MKRLRSLRARLVLWTILLEALALLIAGVILVAVVQQSQDSQISDALRLASTQMNAAIEVHADQIAIESSDNATLQSEGIYVWVLTAKGELMGRFGQANNLPLPQVFPKINQMSTISLSSGEPVRLFTCVLSQNNQAIGLLVLATSLRASQILMQQIYLSLGIVIPISLFLSAVGGLFLANRALEPIAAITHTTRHINAADLSQRVQIDLSDDEIGQLADTLNGMFGRLERAFQRERQLTSDVSHELRTPLAMLKTQLSLGRSRPRDTEALINMMADMEGDVDRMTRLVEQMLMLARLEQPADFERSEVDLTDLLRHLVRVYEERTRERQVEIRLNVPATKRLTLPGSSDQLEQVFSNLVENAIKYNEPGGTITICADRRDQQLIVSVADTGIGIDAAHIPHLFERFYRIDSARARSTGGVGLGLAIAQAIILAHDGTITVESQPGKGSTFTVCFPA